MKIIYNIQYWILNNVIKEDIIQDYCIDFELLEDYYNEPPEYYRNDRD